MTFIDKRLPTDITKDCTGVPTYMVDIAKFKNGAEQRNLTAKYSKSEWNFGYGSSFLSHPTLERVFNFWHVMGMSANSFRFRDWTNYTIGTATNPQSFAVGDGVTTQFQIYKRHQIDTIYREKKITKPNQDVTPVVQINNITVPNTNYTINYLTGVVTFNTPPAAASDISIYIYFDLEVRFDGGITATGQGNLVFDLGSLKILEIASD